MAIRIVAFLSLVCTALALVPYGAHLFSLPNKIGMSEQHYFIAQRAYDNWALISLILIPAMLFNIVLAVLFGPSLPRSISHWQAASAMIATLPIFFAFTYPGNAATQNWTVVPDNWQYLRARWEYSHAVNAILTFASFCLMTAAVLAFRR